MTITLSNNSIGSKFTSVGSDPSIPASSCVEREQPCPFNALPEELISHIFRLVSNSQDFYSLSAVSRTFRILSETIPPPIPKMAFGKAKWEKYIGNIGEEPPLPPNIYNILDSSCSIWKGKKIQETHLLVLVPSIVNGEPLTLSRLGELVKKPKMGHRTCYSYYYPDGNENAQAPENYWILMTKDIIPGSRNKSYDQQATIVKDLASRSHHSYEVPHLIEAATAIFMHYLETREKLYGDNPWTWTRCQEQSSKEKYPMAIGGFAAAGLNVYNCNYPHNPAVLGVSGSCRSWVIG